MSVSFIRKELKKVLPLYSLIGDCLDGQARIKEKRTTYLPQPNANDQSEQNMERYNSYLARAVFYNVAGRTLRGLAGQIFAKPSTIDVPDSILPVVDDASGSRLSLEQCARQSACECLAYGRTGLFVDYPETSGAFSRADVDAGFARPTITVISPMNIINWRTEKVGAKSVLSLVVISETVATMKDEFESDYAVQYRVLRLGKSPKNNSPFLVEGRYYTVEVWSESGSGMGITESYQPRDFNGLLFEEIPFTFIGSENNDERIDTPPMYDIAALNIAHYVNSAEYEEVCFMVGQPTPFFTGLTEEWVKDVLKGTVTLGSRAAVPLPSGATAGLLQTSGSPMPKEAMEHKEKQMVALGAKLVEAASVARTATEASLSNASETSALANISKNVSAAYETALRFCLAFVGDVDYPVSYKLNSDFDLSRMTSQDVAQVIANWQGGAISYTEMRNALRKAGQASQDDETAKDEIAQATV